MCQTSESSVRTTQIEKCEYEVIVVGAGILGCALAAALGRDGRKVLLIERDWKEPDRIVGELLQPGGIKALRELGLEDCLDGIDAIPCNGYAVFYPPQEVVLPYPADKQPNVGRSFHHGRFVMNLRKAAKASPNVTVVEGTAQSLISCPISEQVIGVTFSRKSLDGEAKMKNAYAHLTVVADGCFSKFRKANLKREPTCKSHFVGFVIEDCKLPHPHHGHVILAKPSPILLYQIGTHETRILVDIPGKLPGAANGELRQYMEEVIGPQLPKSIQPSFYKALETERLRSMPNSWLPATTNRRPGLVILGDALNMRHPLTGGGMTVAFWDVVHTRRLLSKESVPELGNTAMVTRRMENLHWTRKRTSAVVNILAQALYSLFSAGDNPHLRTLQLSCFAYFKVGGRCVSTPVGLLAGLIPEPLTLVGHFFAVAFYGVYLCLTNQLESKIAIEDNKADTRNTASKALDAVVELPHNLHRSMMAIWTACVVIFPVIFAEMKS